MGAKSKITNFERTTRAAQARVPLVRAMVAELGYEKAAQIVRRAVREEGEALGRRAAEKAAGDMGITGHSLKQGLEADAAGGALNYEVLACDDTRLDFDVHRCSYAEFMERIGARDLGPMLICDVDFALARGMGVELNRTQTCMQKTGPCNFRFRIPAKEA